MITIITAVDITVRATPEAVFDLISVPDNWPQLIPSSQRVEGDTHRSVGVGARFTDHILVPVTGLATALDYTVRRAERGVILEFDTEKPFGRADVTYTVTYRLEPTTMGTIFSREARTEYSERHPLPKAAVDGILTEPDHGQRYLENVKNRLEANNAS
ncbi:SRPBCC family protein [Nocardia brasiliensis]|uniref:SRPBCC family protein n=1 Tax=Nocardia brasiliensis TaxID=37326 RepID=UPI002457E6A2|nr:SRPBCC family protein [Nocardia brasiliensis]